MDEEPATIRVPLHASDNWRTDPALFIRHLAHELRQPLSCIHAAAFNLDVSMRAASPQVREQVRRIQRMVDEADMLISSAVDLVKSAAPVLTPSDVNNALYEALECSRVRSRIAWRLDEDLPLVHLDTRQFAHALRNVIMLLSRAHAYALEVVTSRRQDAVQVEVSVNLPAEEAADVEAAFREGRHASGPAVVIDSFRRVVNAHAAALTVRNQSGRVSVHLSFARPALADKAMTNASSSPPA
jgi:signal transduction histidine kinase